MFYRVYRSCCDVAPKFQYVLTLNRRIDVVDGVFHDFMKDSLLTLHAVAIQAKYNMMTII